MRSSIAAAPEDQIGQLCTEKSNFSTVLSLFKIFNLFQLRSPYFGFFWLIPGFVEVD